MIYLFTEYEKITDGMIPKLLSALPPKRRMKAARYRYPDGKLSCILGYLIFLYGFRTLYKERGLPDFQTAGNGKPWLEEFPEIFFNISHCNGAAACMFGDMPVGIDIQEKRVLKLSVAKHVCSEEELDRVIHAPEPDLEFCRIWSVKESLSKLSGDGVFRDLKDLRELKPRGVFYNTVFIEPDKYLTASTFNRNEDFAVHKLSSDQLLKLVFTE